MMVNSKTPEGWQLILPTELYYAASQLLAYLQTLYAWLKQ